VAISNAATAAIAMIAKVLFFITLINIAFYRFNKIKTPNLLFSISYKNEK
jgi:hypothetical protein